MSRDSLDNLIVGPNSPLKDIPKIGGKGINLYYMSNLSLNVPNWVALNTDGFDRYFKDIQPVIENSLEGVQSDDLNKIENAARIIYEKIQDIQIENDLIEAILKKIGGENLIAVRSSANVEDGSSYSFAGQLESFLFVRPEQIIQKIKDCWASGFTSRILQYIKLNNVDILKFKVAVIFQHMVKSKCSGVLFTVNPLAVKNFSSQAVITAGYGVGEGIVRDLVETDTYIFDHTQRKIIEANYTEKKIQIVFDEINKSGLVQKAVPSNLSNASVLTHAQIERLVGIGRQLRRFHRMDQDIEWAIDETGKIYITQCRPITSLGKNLSGMDFLFDNSNVVESFPGVSSPWTISMVREVYARTFTNAVRRIGINERTIVENKNIFRHLIGAYRGRIYYNLTNWYQMMRLVPYTESYIKVWEEMLGIERDGHSETQNTADILVRKPLQALRTGLTLGFNFIFLDFRLKALDKELKEIFTQFWRDHHKGYYFQLRPHEIAGKLEFFKDRCFHKWDLTLINDIFTFIWSAVAKKLIRKWISDTEGEKIFNDLLLGEGAMDSILPIKSILAMAQLVQRDKLLEEMLLAMAKMGEVKIDLFKANELHINFGHLFREHIEQFGDRGVAELKLETITFRENPVELAQMVLNYASSQKLMDNNDSDLATIAAERVQSSIGYSGFKRILFNFSLRMAKKSINYRENFRLHRSRAYGVVRRITLILGQRLYTLGVINDPRDIFYLEQTEVQNFIHGLSYHEDLKHKVNLGKFRFEEYNSCKVANKYQFEKLTFRDIPSTIDENQMEDIIQGQPCASGIVEAEALVVTDVTNLSKDITALADKILVAPMTDPGWVFIMTVSKGLIVEKGSILSHTAIIGRELGIPTIVGVKGATSKIKNGDKIRMDGTKGQVQIIGRSKNE